jgi:Leucine-rich repeat (LRR) protein
MSLHKLPLFDSKTKTTAEMPASKPIISLLCLVSALAILSQCSQKFTVSVNNQAIFDPDSRLLDQQTIDSNLQGCINLAVRQQKLISATELTILSCPNSQVSVLDNIEQLARLRFLDLASNSISNLTPLEQLDQLSGLNLVNNIITDISPLFNIASLASVSLSGNLGIDCEQLDALEDKLGDKLTRPASCHN